MLILSIIWIERGKTDKAKTSSFGSGMKNVRDLDQAPIRSFYPSFGLDAIIPTKQSHQTPLVLPDVSLSYTKNKIAYIADNYYCSSSYKYNVQISSVSNLKKL